MAINFKQTPDRRNFFQRPLEVCKSLYEIIFCPNSAEYYFLGTKNKRPWPAALMKPRALILLIIVYLLTSGSLSFAGNNIQTSHAQTANHTTDPVLLVDSDYFDSLIHHIRQAKKRIDVAMFLFKTTDSPKNRPAIIVGELLKAKARGVAVAVLLEQSGHDQELNSENRKTAEILKRGGIAVVFDQPETTTHAKLVIIDQRYVFLGSHNFSHAALAYNHESSLLIDSQDMAMQLLRYMDEIKKR